MAATWADASVKWSDPGVTWTGQEKLVALPRLRVNGADWTDVAVAVEVTGGRTSADEQPGSASMTVDTGPTARNRLPLIGASVELDALVGDPGSAAPAQTLPRFRGRITDVTYDPGARRGRWIAVDDSARLGRLRIGDTPWPQQSDLARVAAIGAAAGVAIATKGASGGVMHARDVDSQPAWDLLASTASDTFGVVHVRGDGTPEYQTSQWRAVPPAPVGLRAGDFEVDGLSWSIVDDYATRVTLKEEGSSPENAVTVIDADAERSYTRRDAQPATIRAWDATGPPSMAAIANSILNAKAWPSWQTGRTVWDSRKPAKDAEGDIGRTIGPLLLQVGDVVRFDGASVEYIPVPPWPDYFLEGWLERWTADGCRMSLALTDSRRYRRVQAPVTGLTLTAPGPLRATCTLPLRPETKGAKFAYGIGAPPYDHAQASFVAGAPGATIQFQYAPPGWTGAEEVWATVWAESVDPRPLTTDGAGPLAGDIGYSEPRWARWTPPAATRKGTLWR